MLSRVADSLYWMSRYLERAEHTARLLAIGADWGDQRPEGELQFWMRVSAALYAPPPDNALDPHRLTEFLAFDRHNPSSVIACMSSARDNARQVREQISSEMWEQLNRQFLALHDMGVNPTMSEDCYSLFVDVIEQLYLFQGATDATMRHGEGWHFIQLGRFLERVQLLSRLLDLHYDPLPPGVPADLELPHYDDWLNLLKMSGAFEAYCKTYTARIAPEAIAEFLLFDPDFPRSVRFAADIVQNELMILSPDNGPWRKGEATRLAGKLRATLDFGQVEEVTGGNAHSYLDGIRGQCGRIHEAIYETYFAYPVDSYLAA
jgi:uncharacterized alpha-E superfamily protein